MEQEQRPSGVKLFGTIWIAGAAALFFAALGSMGYGEWRNAAVFGMGWIVWAAAPFIVVIVGAWLAEVIAEQDRPYPHTPQFTDEQLDRLLAESELRDD